MENTPDRKQPFQKFLRQFGGILILFVLIGLAFTPSYMDPDDATVVAFHAQGENPAVQIPYSLYISGYDLLLTAMNKAFLHNGERSIQITSHSIDLISLLVVMVLIRILFEEQFGDDRRVANFFFILPFAIPELIFWGLDITEGICSLAFMLTGYYLFTRHWGNEWVRLVIGAILLGFGVSVRWEVGLFAIVVAVDLWMNGKVNVLKLGLIVLISFLIFSWSIGTSGYALQNVVGIIQDGSKYTREAEFSALGLLGANISLFTPAAVVLLALGLYDCIRTRSFLMPTTLAIVLGAYLVITHGAFIPKALLPVLLPFFFILFRGFSRVTAWAATPIRTAVLWVALLIPWFVGITLHSNLTSWGPAFELKKSTVATTAAYLKNPDKRLRDVKPGISVGSGFAIATPEGPRPMWGYAWVLLTDWKKFNRVLEQEKETVVQSLIDSPRKRKILLTDNYNSLNVVTLNRHGYSTLDPKNARERDFVKAGTADTIRLTIIPKKASQEYWSAFSKNDEVLVYVTYSSLMSTFVAENSKLTRLGPFSAILVTSGGQ